jgi:TonB family protein
VIIIKRNTIQSLLIKVTLVGVFAFLACCTSKPESGSGYEREYLQAYDSTKIYVRVDEPPTYDKGLEGFQECINSNLKYPEPALSTNVQGKVLLGFVIDLEGNISDINVLRPLGFGCDEAAIAAVLACDYWSSGQLQGKPVQVKMTIAVDFSLPAE